MEDATAGTTDASSRIEIDHRTRGLRVVASAATVTGVSSTSAAPQPFAYRKGAAGRLNGAGAPHGVCTSAMVGTNMWWTRSLPRSPEGTRCPNAVVNVRSGASAPSQPPTTTVAHTTVSAPITRARVTRSGALVM